MQHELLSGDIMAGALAAAPGTSLASTWAAERKGLVQLWPRLFWEGKPGWEMGSERGVGLAEGVVPLELRSSQHHSQQLMWTLPLVPSLAIPLCPCSAISAQHWHCFGPCSPLQQLLLWRDKLKKEAWVCASVRGCHNNHCVFFPYWAKMINLISKWGIFSE